jgi:hypothetical protein
MEEEKRSDEVVILSLYKGVAMTDHNNTLRHVKIDHTDLDIALYKESILLSPQRLP